MSQLRRLALLSLPLLLAGCTPPLYPESGARDPEGLEAQRAAAHAIERAEEAGRSLETRNQWGATPLYEASGTGGSYKAIQRLLAAGANIEGRSYDVGATALFAACSASINHAHGSIQPRFEVYQRVRVLLEAGADPNARNSRGETVLMTMTGSYGGDCERAVMLIEHGARVDAKDNMGKTPLMHNVRRGEIAEVILAVPQDLEARDATGRTALSWAAVQSSDYEGSTLHQLLDRGAQVESVDDNGRTPLMHAFEDGHAQNVITLLLHGARADRGGWTPLMITAFDAYHFAARSLIEKGAAVNDTDFAGRTALHWAAKGFAHPELYRLLINAGADVNAADQDGWTPLHVAARRASPEHVQVLLDAGANP